ncbi:hypothetical protein Pcinc_012043 [Petrolisthes cinctipes]|uniref:MADF domain-containing protein n=1 Tax=Petrolisthes cinctipes TaxID=88211 RepID=A0AAE1FZX5_PETCI|nr:hypothetical protein Pcinc_012043 [Petrolisthes cinctipes]
MPSFSGITGQRLRILGVVRIPIKVGKQGVHEQLVSVVPDSFINKDLLLGTDVLSKSKLVWSGETGIVIWGGAPNHVHRVKLARKEVQHIKIEGKMSESPVQRTGNINARVSVHLQPYQMEIVHIAVSEPVGLMLLVTPRHTVSRQVHPVLVQVNEQRLIPSMIYNPAKVDKKLEKGTMLGTYELVENSDCVEIVSPKVRKTDIVNDMLPDFDTVEGAGTRREKLERLIQEQDWDPLSDEQRQALSSLVLENEALFIVNQQELGTLQGRPVNIKVADPQPCRTSLYRYPEKAKQIISQMLDEMEERGVIEPSSAAWLSPIVLVNKPNGSKRLCLDFRRGNEHLSEDIYPLPRLDDLVNTAAGHQFYATLDLKDAYYQIVLDQESPSTRSSTGHRARGLCSSTVNFSGQTIKLPFSAPSAGSGWKSDIYAKRTRDKRAAALKHIAQTTGRSESDVKKKIDSLRNQHRREMRLMATSQKSGAGTDEIYTPKLWCFDILSFLNDGDCVRSSVSNMKNTTSNQQATASVSDDVSDSEIFTDPLLSKQEDSHRASSTATTSGCHMDYTRIREQTPVPSTSGCRMDNTRLREHSPVPSTIQRPTKRARVPDDTDKVIEQSLGQLNALSSTHDSDDDFGTVVAHGLRHMHGDTKIYAEKLINDVLFMGKLGKITASTKLTE